MHLEHADFILYIKKNNVVIILSGILSNLYVIVLYITMWCYHFSYREQMVKEMSEFLSRLVQCNPGE